MSSVIKLPSLIKSAVCHTKTKTGYTQANHLWIINDFERIHANRNVFLRSLPFSADGIFQWRLQLFPYGFIKDSKSMYLWLNICDFYNNNLHKLEHHPVTGTFKASIMNSENQAAITKILNFTKSELDRDFDDTVRANLVEINHLFAARDELLPQDRLTISCEINYIKQSDIVSTSGKSFSFVPLLKKNEHTEEEDFEKLYKNDEFADVTILVNGKKYRAHKGILAARSPVLKTMLRAAKIERKSNRIEINDLDKSIFNEMLHYIYTGKPKNLKKNVIGLLEAADKYDLKQLKIICENELIENLSKDNVGNVLMLAEKYDSADLKNAAVQFSKVNFFDTDVTFTEKIQNCLDWASGKFRAFVYKDNYEGLVFLIVFPCLMIVGIILFPSTK